MITLRPHQVLNRDHLYEVMKRHGGAIDASAVGTGKTMTAIGLCKALNARPAIVTRKAVIPAWRDACKLMGVEPLFVYNYEQLASKACPHTVVDVVHNKKVMAKREERIAMLRGVVANQPAMAAEAQQELTALLDKAPTTQKKFKGWKNLDPRTIFFFDESQALRSQTSFISKAAISARTQRKCALLSATPFTTPLEAYVHGMLTGAFNQDSYYRWLFNHGCKKDFMGHMAFVGDHDPEAGYAEMLKVRAQFFPERGCRTRREDIPGFPETLILPELVDTGAADDITKVYLRELDVLRQRDHQRACLGVDPEFHDLVDVMPVTVDLRCRQEVELLKVPVFVEEARAARDKGDKVAIFCNFDATIDVLSEILKTKCIIRGARKSSNYAERENSIASFQSNHQDFILVNTLAGGAGVSLHDPVKGVHRTSIINIPLSAVALKQVLGRVSRLGGGYSTQKLLFARGTVEERMYERVSARMNNLDLLTDGELSVDYSVTQ